MKTSFLFNSLSFFLAIISALSTNSTNIDSNYKSECDSYTVNC